MQRERENKRGRAGQRDRGGACGNRFFSTHRVGGRRQEGGKQDRTRSFFVFDDEQAMDPFKVHQLDHIFERVYQGEDQSDDDHEVTGDFSPFPYLLPASSAKLRISRTRLVRTWVRVPATPVSRTT